MKYKNQVGWREVKKPDGFISQFEKVASVKGMFPEFKGNRIMMMPFHLANPRGTLPSYLHQWLPIVEKAITNTPVHVRYWKDSVAYLTIDEKFISAGTIQRKPGKHVDGMYKGKIAGAWGGGGGGWGSTGNGMLLVSNTDNLCSAWKGEFKGTPVNDGDCEHLSDQCTDDRRTDFKNGDVFWMDGLAVHESYPAKEDTYRQFLRISMPSASPWFKGYSENPLGIMPAGEILNEKRI